MISVGDYTNLYNVSYSYDNKAKILHMQTTIKHQLERLGLSDQEATLYVLLLEHGPAGASFLAKKAGLARSSVYTTLSVLSSKGLVGTTYQNEVKQFLAEPPEAIEQILRRQKNEAEQRLDLFDELKQSLSGLRSGSSHIPQVTFFEGKDGLQCIYKSLLREASPGAVMRLMRDEFIWSEDWAFVFKGRWRGQVDRIKKEKGITTQLLINQSAVERKKASYYKTRKDVAWKHLPKSQSLKDFGMYLVDDMMCILSLEHNNLVGIKVVNKNLVENFTQVFDMLWGRR